MNKYDKTEADRCRYQVSGYQRGEGCGRAKIYEGN